jgi:hypothetical protein
MFDWQDFYISLSSYGNVEFSDGDGNGDIVPFIDPSQGGGGIDWDNFNFGDTTQDEPPSILNGGEFDVISELFDLMSNDPILNNLIENADTIYEGDLQFSTWLSSSDYFAAIYESISSGYYDDFFNFLWDEDMRDFSHQYNWFEELGGFIKEYV